MLSHLPQRPFQRLLYPSSEKKRIEAWYWGDTSTLKGYPIYSFYPWPGGRRDSLPEDAPLNPRNEFLEFKERELEKINDRLRTLRDRESTLSGPIDGMEIKIMLRRLAEPETAIFSTGSLVSCPRNKRYFAGSQLAVFPGANEDPYLTDTGRESNAEKQPTGSGP